jgi:hypothetical protein
MHNLSLPCRFLSNENYIIVHHNVNDKLIVSEAERKYFSFRQEDQGIAHRHNGRPQEISIDRYRMRGKEPFPDESYIEDA